MTSFKCRSCAHTEILLQRLEPNGSGHWELKYSLWYWLVFISESTVYDTRSHIRTWIHSFILKQMSMLYGECRKRILIYSLKDVAFCDNLLHSSNFIQDCVVDRYSSKKLFGVNSFALNQKNYMKIMDKILIFMETSSFANQCYEFNVFIAVSRAIFKRCN